MKKKTGLIVAGIVVLLAIVSFIFRYVNLKTEDESEPLGI